MSAARMQQPGKKAASLCAMRHAVRQFGREEDGALVVFALYIFLLIIAFCGLAVDVIQFETTRTRMQNTLDRAILAAASLNQTVDPEAVVNDYFARAGMSDFLQDVTVEEGLNYRKVSATGGLTMATSFMHLVGEDSLSVSAAGTAEESIGNVEISLVLDVSGSMNSYNRLDNLKIATGNFLDTVYGATETGTVSTAIVPYATQVNAGASILAHFNRGSEAHETSHCLNFATTDFDQPFVDLTSPVEQTMDFDPWYTSTSLVLPVCPTTPETEIMPWSQDLDALKAKANGLIAQGNTSTDIGLKWGAALLDPSTRDIVTTMVSDGELAEGMLERPRDYTDPDTLKVIVVMTDGVNTSQYVMDDPYRSGNSPAWLYIDGSDRYISMWDGSSDPTDAELGLPGTSEPSSENWYIPHLDDWQSTPFGDDDAVRLTYPDLWSEVTVRYHAYYHVYPMHWDYQARNDILYSYSYVGSSTKNTQMDAICTVAKDSGVVIFAVGLEVSDSSANRLQSCASSPAHFFRVDGLDINLAFKSIAGQINQLKLTH